MISALAQFGRLCLAPPTCEACDALVPTPPGLCRACREALIPLREEHCVRCALPFPRGAVAGHCCADCLATPPSFARVDAAFEFDGTAERLLRALKFGRHETALAPLVRAAAPAFRRAWEAFRPHALFPVPLSAWRRWRRGFNQSYLLAAALAQAAEVKLPLRVGARRRTSPPQARRGRLERLRALRGAFAVREPELRGRRILVVDDVMTTGATVEAFCKSLLQAGAEAVQVFVLARTARDRDLKSTRSLRE